VLLVQPEGSLLSTLRLGPVMNCMNPPAPLCPISWRSSV